MIHVSFFTKNTLAVGIAALFMTNAAAQTVVDYPGSQNHENYIEVYRTATDQKQTVFDVTVYNRPGYWIQLSSAGVLHGCQTGKTYRMVKAEGFEMDKQVAMPDSGCRDFKCYFEPIDACDQTVHWIDRENDTLFTALNVRPIPRSKEMFACRIKGTVAGERPCVRLLFYDFDQDNRVRPPLSIPVRGNRFDYTYYTDKPEVKILTKWNEYMEGSWYVIPFFVEQGENEITILPKGRDLELHRATTANQEWKRIRQETDRRESECQLDEYYKIMSEMSSQQVLTPEAFALHEQLQTLYEKMEKQGEDKTLRDSIYLLYKQRAQLKEAQKMYSPEYTQLRENVDRIRSLINRTMVTQMAKSPSLPALYRLYQLTAEAIDKNSPDLQPYYHIYQRSFAPLWSEHPLGKHLEYKTQAGIQMKVGEQYPLFEARDLDGKQVSVNGLIKGKWALVDLWASWCGPCRKNSKQMIPVYQKYADKGFTVVGIAREQNVSDALEAIRKDGYPWVQLIDLHDEFCIWLRHGIGNVGGSTFLVNPEGKIAAIGPSAEEVEAILEQHLGGQVRYPVHVSRQPQSKRHLGECD